MNQLSRTIAIVGAAESDEIGLVPSKSPLQHHAEAGHNALADAGLSVKDVDGLFTAGYSTLATAEYMGIRPKYTDSTSVGGSSVGAGRARTCGVDAGASSGAPSPRRRSVRTSSCSRSQHPESECGNAVETCRATEPGLAAVVEACAGMRRE